MLPSSYPPVYPILYGSMHAGQDSVTHRQKRQRDVGESFSETSTPRVEHLAKRPRLLSKTRHTHKQHSPNSSWDRLSKVWLTRRALEELDRRTAKPRPLPSQPEGSLSIAADWGRLKRFARHGGPDLCDLRGYPDPADLSRAYLAMHSSRSRSTSRRSRAINVPNRSTDTPPQSIRKTTTSDRKSSAHDANFEQILIDHGAYPDEHDYPDDHIPPLPNNWDEVLQRISRSRASLSPSRFPETEFRKFKRVNAHALGEKKVMSSVFPTIRGDADIPFEEDKLFGNLIPFATGIVDAKPDFYDGAHAGQLDYRVRSELSGYIIPSTQHNAPILPNFFVEGKGPESSTAVGRRQALYDGTLGARAMLQLQSYGKRLAHDCNAYAITSTYQDGTLKLFTVHPTESRSSARDTDFHMNLLGAWALIGSLEQFRQGSRALRNARDWAKEQRNQFITAANSNVADMRADMSFETSNPTLLSHSTHLSHDSETSADELTSAEVTRIDRFTRKRALSQSRRGSESRSKSSRR